MKEPLTTPPPPSGLRRYAALLAPYRRAYALGLALMALTNGLSLAVPWLVKTGLDALTFGEPGGPAVAPPLGARGALAGLVAIGALLLVIRTGSRWYLLGAGRELARDLRDRLHAAALAAPPVFHARFATGEVVSRSTSDVSTLQSVGSAGMLYAANALFTLALATPWLLWLDPGLGALVLAPLPALGLFVTAASARVRVHAQAVQEAMAALTRTAQETLAGIEVVRSFALEARQASRFAGHNDAILAASVRESLLRTSIGGATVVAGALSTAALVVVGGRRVAAGALTVGDLALVLTVLALVLRTIVFLGWVVSLLQRGLASLDRVDELLAAASPLPVVGPGRAGPLEGRLELRGLTVRHAVPPGAPPRRPALEEVTLDVAPGRALGLTGPVGSGKSTLLQAVARLVDAPPGAVLVDGTPVEAWDPAALRGGLGWVPQDGVTFSMTLAENVAFGRPDATREQVTDAVRAAALEKDLDQLPGGLDVLVGERGVTLSGGQRQRLAIARALLVRPRLLLLDDALSMVDAETAAAILRALRAALPGTTLLVAAHRTATLLGCDEVVVLDRGRVVERGPPAELLARADGRFAALHERQRLEASLEASA